MKKNVGNNGSAFESVILRNLDRVQFSKKKGCFPLNHFFDENSFTRISLGCQNKPLKNEKIHRKIARIVLVGCYLLAASWLSSRKCIIISLCEFVLNIAKIFPTVQPQESQSQENLMS